MSKTKRLSNEQKLTLMCMANEKYSEILPLTNFLGPKTIDDHFVVYDMPDGHAIAQFWFSACEGYGPTTKIVSMEIGG